MASRPDGHEPERGRPAPPNVPAMTDPANAAGGGGNPPAPPATGTSILGGGLAGLAHRGLQLMQGLSPSAPRKNNIVVTTGTAGTPASGEAATNANGTPQTSNRSRGPTPSHRSAPSNLNTHLAGASLGGPPALRSPSQEAGGEIPVETAVWPCPKECGAGPWPMTRKRCSCQAWRPGSRRGLTRRTKDAIQAEEERGRQLAISTPPAASATSGAPSNAPPVIGVNVPPALAGADVSPMTADDDTTVTSVDTAGTVDTAAVAGLAQAERDEKGDGGDSDEEGFGFFIEADLDGAAKETMIDKRMNDYNEIESNVMDDDANGIECLTGSPSSLPGRCYNFSLLLGMSLTQCLLRASSRSAGGLESTEPTRRLATKSPSR